MTAQFMKVFSIAQSVFGTFDYAPPEQQGYGGKQNAKSDVYAFGKTLYRLLTGEIPQTWHPRRLPKAPELFELLCDCVEWEVDKRPDVGSLIVKFGALSSQVGSKPTTVVSKKPVEKKVEGARQVDNRIWWNKLDNKWKHIFRKASKIYTEPTDSDLVKIVHLQKLDCRMNHISDLEPLRQLTNLQELKCFCNPISDLEPLRQLSRLQVLICYSNQISNLKPLHQLTIFLDVLYCSDNKIGWWNLRKFKKALPNCRVSS